MNEKKVILPSLMKQDWKKVKVEFEKVNKIFEIYPNEVNE